VAEVEAGWTPLEIPTHAPELRFEAYGVPIAVRGSNAEVIERFRPYIPPGAKPLTSDNVQRRFEIRQEPAGTYQFFKDGQSQTVGINLELAVLMLDTEIRLFIARKAPGAIFVHAGVVAHHGKAIVLPGLSFAGKTRLVAALVRAGAVYFSDEFAVLDEDGRVRPYPKPLSLRDENQIQVEQSVESLGGTAGDEPMPIGLIAVTAYKPGGVWNPRRLSAGEGAISLLANTVPARERPEESLRAIRRAIGGAVFLESDRGEAEDVVPALLAEIEAQQK
jgi:hypothetical protein